MKFKNHGSRLIKNELKEKNLKLIKIVTERMITTLQSDLICFKPYNHKLITYKLSTQSPKPKTLNSPLALSHTHAKTKRNNPT